MAWPFGTWHVDSPGAHVEQTPALQYCPAPQHVSPHARSEGQHSCWPTRPVQVVPCAQQFFPQACDGSQQVPAAGSMHVLKGPQQFGPQSCDCAQHAPVWVQAPSSEGQQVEPHVLLPIGHPCPVGMHLSFFGS